MVSVELNVNVPPAPSEEVEPETLPSNTRLPIVGGTGSIGMPSAGSTLFTSAPFGPSGSISLKNIGNCGAWAVTPAGNVSVSTFLYNDSPLSRKPEGLQQTMAF